MHWPETKDKRIQINVKYHKIAFLKEVRMIENMFSFEFYLTTFHFHKINYICSSSNLKQKYSFQTQI